MPFDGIITNKVVLEFNNEILNARIEKIYQPKIDEIVFYLHNNQKHFKLVLSANAQNCRANLTNFSSENPSKAPNFCLLLRKYLQNGKIKKIVQIGMDRIIEFNIESSNEIGDLTTKTLVIEIMGKYSNIILLNDSRIVIDSIKHVDFSTSRVREILPGRHYEYPTQNKLNILNTDLNSIDLTNIENIPKFITDTFVGISTFIANIISYNKRNINEILYNLVNFIKSTDNASLIYSNGILKDFYLDSESNKPVNEIIDLFYYEKNIQNNFLCMQKDLIKVVNQYHSKCIKNLDIACKNLDKSKDYEKFKILGELLIANLYKISDNTKEIEVENYYETDFPLIKIKLDEALTPNQNAKKFFKRYNKLKATYEYSNEQILNLNKDKMYFESILSELELASDINELEDIKQELALQGLISNKKNEIKKVEASEPYKFVLEDGFEIYVGKNNKQNDFLSLKFAKPNDVWLHVQKMPSSHVIVRSKQGNISDNALLRAGELCAFYSKARLSQNVAIDYTFAKNVEKPKGSKPGFVIYTNFKTIFVNPKK